LHGAAPHEAEHGIVGVVGDEGEARLRTPLGMGGRRQARLHSKDEHAEKHKTNK
jgi:hypothetical protein